VEYQEPIDSGPTRGAKIAAIVVLAMFAFWLMFLWADDGDGGPDDDEPGIELEEGTLPPEVGGDGVPASGDGVLPATP
jgi:hypothetical protein